MFVRLHGIQRQLNVLYAHSNASCGRKNSVGMTKENIGEYCWKMFILDRCPTTLNYNGCVRLFSNNNAPQKLPSILSSTSAATTVGDRNYLASYIKILASIYLPEIRPRIITGRNDTKLQSLGVSDIQRFYLKNKLAPRDPETIQTFRREGDALLKYATLKFSNIFNVKNERFFDFVQSNTSIRDFLVQECGYQQKNFTVFYKCAPNESVSNARVGDFFEAWIGKLHHDKNFIDYLIFVHSYLTIQICKFP